MIVGGLPYISELADYGTLAAMYRSAPYVFAEEFCKVVFLSVIIDIFKPLLGAGKRVKFSMTKVFVIIVTTILSTVILKTFVMKLGAYSAVVSFVGAVFSVFSVISTVGISMNLLMTFTGSQLTTGLFAIVTITMDNPISKLIRNAFVKALFYLLAIFAIEKYCGSIFNGTITISNIVVAFMPAVIMIFGLIIVLSSVF
ncbi:MAG: hypothetical protein IJZ20_01510, partial [Clostridia bacterium]|nr:hypothetical protein [Clostridia bacterium]